MVKRGEKHRKRTPGSAKGYADRIERNGYQIDSMLSGPGALLKPLRHTDPRWLATTLGNIIEDHAGVMIGRLDLLVGEKAVIDEDAWWAAFGSPSSFAEMVGFMLSVGSDALPMPLTHDIAAEILSGGSVLSDLIVVTARAVLPAEPNGLEPHAPQDEPWLLGVPAFARETPYEPLDAAFVLAARRLGVSVAASEARAQGGWGVAGERDHLDAKEAVLGSSVWRDRRWRRNALSNEVVHARALLASLRLIGERIPFSGAVGTVGIVRSQALFRTLERAQLLTCRDGILTLGPAAAPPGSERGLETTHGTGRSPMRQLQETE